MNPEKRTIAVTGANGFIGSCLVEYFAGKDWQVRALQRKPGATEQNNVTYHQFSLGEPLDEKDFNGIDWLVHSAYQVYSAKNRDADRINREGTNDLIRVCRKNDINIIFLSSFSAHEEAESHYGRSKLEVETLFDLQRDTVLRLGLVLGNAGLFSNTVDITRKLKIIPLIDNGSQPVQILLLDDLCRIIEKLTDSKLSGKYNVATTEIYTIRDLYKQVADQLHLKRFFVPFPLILLQLIVGVIELLRIPIGIDSENVLGLKHMRSFETKEDLEALGIKLSALKQSIESLL